MQQSPVPIHRVVSLLPSATEVLCAIPGGQDLLVGRSHECDAPAGKPLSDLPALTASRTRFTTAADVDAQVRALSAGGDPQSLYTLDTGRLVELKPDVILTQDLCSVCSIDLASVRRVVSSHLPGTRIVSLNPHTVEGVLDSVLTVGEAVGRAADAAHVATALRERLYAASEYVNPYTDGPSVVFLEWTDPLFVGGHWTPQLIERAGGRHPINPTQPIGPEAGAAAGPIGQTQRAAGKSVTVPPEVVAALAPDRVIVCPCGLTLDQARTEAAALTAQRWFAALPACARGGVAIVDGSAMFNRPGPRLVDAFCWLVGWLNDRPEIIPPNFPWEPVTP